MAMATDDFLKVSIDVRGDANAVYPRVRVLAASGQVDVRTVSTRERRQTVEERPRGYAKCQLSTATSGGAARTYRRSDEQTADDGV